MSELKPCPFCGKSKVGAIKKENKYRIVCVNPNCHITPHTNWEDTKQNAVEEWNRRADNE